MLTLTCLVVGALKLDIPVYAVEDNSSAATVIKDTDEVDPSEIPAALKAGGQIKNVPDPGVGIPSKITDLAKMTQSGNTVTLLPVIESNLIPLGTQRLVPFKLEASYQRNISLRQALEVALENNLPIKAAVAEYQASKYQYLGSFGNFLPSMSLNYFNMHTTGSGIDIRTKPFYVLLNYPLFQGGSDFFNTMQARHGMKASRYGYSAETNRALLSVFEKYMDLLATRALLDVRTVAVTVAREQQRTNKYMKAAGMGTQFDVMQSATLLAQEKQKLIQAEVNLRQAAISLSVALNVPVIGNLVPTESSISGEPMISEQTNVQSLESIAMTNRPEVGQFENLAWRHEQNCAGG